MSIVARGDRPAHHVPREQVEDRGQIDLDAGADHEFGGVADPALIGSLGGRRASQHVIRGRLIVGAHRRVLIPAAHQRDETVFLHQPSHAFPTDVFLPLDEVIVAPWAAVIVAASGERRVDQGFDPIACAG